MTTFSDLPNELLYETLHLTLPEDLENFAQISKRIQEVARPLLADHRALIRKYRRFENILNGKKAITLLLQDFLTNPHIGHYVRQARVNSDRSLYYPELYTESEIKSLCKVAAESNHLTPNQDATAVHFLQADIKSTGEALLLLFYCHFYQI